MSLVDDVRRQITERLKELKPLVDEYHQPRGDGREARSRRRKVVGPASVGPSALERAYQ